MISFPYVSAEALILQRGEAGYIVSRFYGPTPSILDTEILERFDGSQLKIFRTLAQANIHRQGGGAVLSQNSYTILSFFNEATGRISRLSPVDNVYLDAESIAPTTFGELMGDNDFHVNSIQRDHDNFIITVGDTVDAIGSGRPRVIMSITKQRNTNSIINLSNDVHVAPSAILSRAQARVTTLVETEAEAQAREQAQEQASKGYFQPAKFTFSKPKVEAKPVLKYPDFTKYFDEDSELKGLSIEKELIKFTYECGEIHLFSNGSFNIVESVH
jgi:hypothetical protein